MLGELRVDPREAFEGDRDLPSARLSAIAAFALLASDADGLAGFVIGSPKDESFVTVSAADEVHGIAGDAGGNARTCHMIDTFGQVGRQRLAGTGVDRREQFDVPRLPERLLEPEVVGGAVVAFDLAPVPG